MKIKNLLIGVAAVAVFGSGCVSKQKFNDMTKARDHFKAQFENLKASESEKTELQNKLRIAESQLQLSKDELAQQQLENKRIKEYNQELTNRFETASKENAKLLSSYSTDKSQFEEKLASSEDELLARERQMQGLETTLGLQTYSMESMKMDLATRERRVAELERALAEKEAQMAALRTSLASALKGYTAADLSMSEKNGKIYVSLSQNLLFAKGSDQLDAKGKTALQQLASALNDNPNIEIIVEGHTDDSGSVNYNWDLSTRRATEVVKILALNGVLPNRMTAAGRGMHQPVVPNSDEASKAKNRRTEIILSPNLDKLMELSK
jgi:chemotaxis protein MotB